MNKVSNTANFCAFITLIVLHICFTEGVFNWTNCGLKMLLLNNVRKEIKQKNTFIRSKLHVYLKAALFFHYKSNIMDTTGN